MRWAYQFVVILLVMVSCERRGGTTESPVKLPAVMTAESMAAFDAIYAAAREHNRVYLANTSRDDGANGWAYSAGIRHLEGSVPGQGPLGKKIIQAVIATQNYEQKLLVSFDKVNAQIKGMNGWTRNAAVQRRGYIQIISQCILNCDEALSYFESGREPLLRQNFGRMGVPLEVSEEFIRLENAAGEKQDEHLIGMARKERAALESLREAMTTHDPAKSSEKQKLAAKQHKEAEAFRSKFHAEIRKGM